MSRKAFTLPVDARIRREYDVRRYGASIDRLLSELKNASALPSVLRKDGHVFKIIIDNAAKKNSFSPQMMAQISDASPSCTTATSIGRASSVPRVLISLQVSICGYFSARGPKNGDLKEGNIDLFGLANGCRKPMVTAVQGIVFNIGIEMMLAGDLVAADDCRFGEACCADHPHPRGRGARSLARVNPPNPTATATACPSSSARDGREPRTPGGINFDAGPKDLDRMIDAALDCVAEVLWSDAGHRAPMQVTADGVEKLHGHEDLQGRDLRAGPCGYPHAGLPVPVVNQKRAYW